MFGTQVKIAIYPVNQRLNPIRANIAVIAIKLGGACNT